MINFSNKILPECRSWKEAGQEGRDGEKSWGGGGMDLKDWTMGPSSWNPNISSLLLAVNGQAIWLQELAKKGTEPGHKLNYQLQWGWCLSSDTFNSLAVWELQPSEALPASEVLQAFTLPRLPRHPAPPPLLFTVDSAKQTFPPADCRLPKLSASLLRPRATVSGFAGCCCLGCTRGQMRASLGVPGSSRERQCGWKTINLPRRRVSCPHQRAVSQTPGKSTWLEVSHVTRKPVIKEGLESSN